MQHKIPGHIHVLAQLCYAMITDQEAYRGLTILFFIIIFCLGDMCDFDP